jgi:hypothetical protein
MVNGNKEDKTKMVENLQEMPYHNDSILLASKQLVIVEQGATLNKNYMELVRLE